MQRLLLLSSLSFLLISCAPYQQEDSWHNVGYKDTPLSNNTAQIRYTACPVGCSLADADKMALKRAAHYTSEHGYRYFSIINKTHNSINRTTYTSATPMTLPYPVTILTIKMVSTPGPNTYSAQ